MFGFMVAGFPCLAGIGSEIQLTGWNSKNMPASREFVLGNAELFETRLLMGYSGAASRIIILPTRGTPTHDESRLQTSCRRALSDPPLRIHARPNFQCGAPPR